MRKPINSLAARYVWIEKGIRSVFLKWCLGHISELNYFSESVCRNYTGHSVRTSVSANEISGGKPVTPLDWLSLEGVCIYKQLFVSQSNEVAELTEAHFDSSKWAASLEKR